ncbi:hypothetical protein [Croceimicrobium hydrocarbonivorans]|uniref:YD repeat-containing protein n=1 Tax=Croceimicrobium hydrocarbonivorans TaxID=2761580 RepID=A0A7H0VEB8_9FLAO|nr:hypothetical protein [Croceimicrobium hydrocarbonivorans]QNR24066.1 hypothetical protein H4K34_17095 [Croceimicrobium hydrocarbonivorans]
MKALFICTLLILQSPSLWAQEKIIKALGIKSKSEINQYFENGVLESSDTIKDLIQYDSAGRIANIKDFSYMNIYPSPINQRHYYNEDGSLAFELSFYPDSNQLSGDSQDTFRFQEYVYDPKGKLVETKLQFFDLGETIYYQYNNLGKLVSAMGYDLKGNVSTFSILKYHKDSLIDLFVTGSNSMSSEYRYFYEPETNQLRYRETWNRGYKIVEHFNSLGEISYSKVSHDNKQVAERRYIYTNGLLTEEHYSEITEEGDKNLIYRTFYIYE